MKLPFNDKPKIFFFLSAITIVVALEILSIIGIHIPMPYAPFVLLFSFSVLVTMFCGTE